MLSKVQVEEYNERGYIVVPDVLSRAEVKELQDVTARMVEESRHLTKGDERFDLEPFHSAERPALRRIKTPHLFAAVIASALLGIALFGAVTWMGSTLLARWGSTGE